MLLSDMQISALGDLLIDTYDDVEIGIAQLGIDPETVSYPRRGLWEVCEIRQCHECGVWCHKRGPLHNCIKNARPIPTRSPEPVAKPERVVATIICRCGQPVRFNSEDRCEDCFATDSDTYSGRPQNVLHL